MATFDRGFKAWCERTAVGIRRTLGLQSMDPLPPEQLASHLGVELLTPHDLPGLPQAVQVQLLEKDPWGWSAVTVTTDGASFVIFNPRKSLGRRASDIVHELGHLMLQHQPSTIILSQDGDVGIRSFDQKQEDEANWLAWCVLLPRDALVAARTRGWSVDQIAEIYGVTSTLVRFRVSKTGVELQLARRAPRGRRRSN